MDLICMGLNHEAAPVQVREHFAVETDEQGVRAKEIIALSTIAESVVISTCKPYGGLCRRRASRQGY